MEADKKIGKGRPEKEDKFVTISTRITVDLKERIDAKAGAAKRSRSDFLRLLLEKHVS